MPRYYDPTTGTEALEGIHDTTGATELADMPTTSQEWFTRPSADGYRWETDPTGMFPIEVLIPPPTDAELRLSERAWAASELAITDPILLTDSPYTDIERQQVITYRDSLRNPAREATAGYPAITWRPVFPLGVKRSGV